MRYRHIIATVHDCLTTSRTRVRTPICSCMPTFLIACLPPCLLAAVVFLLVVQVLCSCYRSYAHLFRGPASSATG